MLTFIMIGQLYKMKKALNLHLAVFLEVIFVRHYIYIFFSLKAFKTLVSEAD